jgi:death on curing protein
VTAPIWIATESVRLAHDEQIAEHGGSAGIRDAGLLESALHKPQNLFASINPPPTIYRLATSYAFGLARNNPFIDGNKRTVLVVSIGFLLINGFELIAPKEERYLQFLRLAEGTEDEESMTAWFERNRRPRAETR